MVIDSTRRVARYTATPNKARRTVELLFRRPGGVGDSESACRRGSVRPIEVCPIGLRSHPSMRSTWRGPTGGPVGRTSRPCLQFDLAPGGVYRAARSPGRWCALTAPLHPCLCGPPRRDEEDEPSAVYFLLHFPAGHPDWPLASTMLCGAPTFLSGFGCPMPPRLRDRLTIDDHHTTAHLVKDEPLRPPGSDPGNSEN